MSGPYVATLNLTVQAPAQNLTISVPGIQGAPGTPSNLVSALVYVPLQLNTGGVAGGGSIQSGSNLLTITPDSPFQFSAANVGMNIYVSGAYAGAYTTIASYISPTQVHLTANATSTSTLANVFVWNIGQDDQAGITATLNAAAGAQATAYFPTRCYVYDAESTNPATLEGITFDGENSTFFIAKNSSVTGNFLNIKNAPTDFTLGGVGKGFTQHGPGASTPIHCTSASVSAGGVMTVTVDNSQTAHVGAVYKVLGSRAPGGTLVAAYNDTYWQITSSSSTGWIGNPIYWDLNPALGTISNVTVDGSGNVTVLESNPYRRVGYVNFFSGLTTATFLNGISLIVTSIVYSGTTVTGYVYASALSTYASAADTGTVSNFGSSSGTLTDTFVSIPDWNGVRVASNVLTTGTHITFHQDNLGFTCANNAGAGISIYTPNYGVSDELSAVANNLGIVFGSTHPTTGFWSNPSAYEIGGGCEVEGNTLVGLYIRNGAGITIGMIGTGGNGIGVLKYGANGVATPAFDNEAQTPWSVDPVLFPGHNFEVRGAKNCTVGNGYLSFNSSINQIGVYIWDSSKGCIYAGGDHNLAGGLVQPTNEFYIDSTCTGCSVIEPSLVSSTAWSNLSPTSTVTMAGNRYYNGGSANSFNLQNIQPATSGGNHSSPILNLISTGWNGTSSVQSLWGASASIAAGTNSVTTLLLSHTYVGGSLGGSNVSINGNMIIDSSGYFTKYLSLTTVSPGVPVLQAKTHGSALTANITSTSLLGTTTQAGIYRATVYVEVAQVATTSSTMPDLRIIYTNPAGASITRQATAGSTGNSLTTFASADFPISVGAAASITFDMGQVTPYASSGATVMQFNYYIRLEYIG